MLLFPCAPRHSDCCGAKNNSGASANSAPPCGLPAASLQKIPSAARQIHRTTQFVRGAFDAQPDPPTFPAELTLGLLGFFVHATAPHQTRRESLERSAISNSLTFQRKSVWHARRCLQGNP